MRETWNVQWGAPIAVSNAHHEWAKKGNPANEKTFFSLLSKDDQIDLGPCQKSQEDPPKSRYKGKPWGGGKIKEISSDHAQSDLNQGDRDACLDRDETAQKDQ